MLAFLLNIMQPDGPIFCVQNYNHQLYHREEGSVHLLMDNRLVLVKAQDVNIMASSSAEL